MAYSLREIRDDDHEFLVSLHNDPLVLRNITDPTPITFESHMKWWNEIQKSELEERFIFCVDGARAGLAKFYRIDRQNRSCDLGGDLHVNFRGKGHARHMWKLMLQRCFEVHALHRVALTTAEYNEIGYHIYKRLGFKEEGRKTSSLYRDGRFYDEICMRILKDEYEEAK